MKIKKIETLPLNAKLEKPLSIATTKFEYVRALITKVTTDDGLVGIGESVVRSAPKAMKYIVEETLTPLILGKDPLNISGIWWDMFSAMRTRGHTNGHFVEAISSIDIALWDIIGKYYNLPVYKALHGYGRKKFTAYASSIFNGEIDNMVNRAQDFLDLGYKAMKVKLGMGLAKDFQAIKAIRSYVGDDVKLMVDINSKYDAATSIRLGRKIEEFNIEWIEEPVPPYDFEGYKKVKNGQAIPIAGGEGEFTVFGFKKLLDTGALDLVQPDIGRVGGLTEAMRIASLVYTNNLNVQPHTGFFSGLNIIAALHFAAATPNLLTFEFMELDHPLIEIFKSPIIRPKNGMIELWDKPGLGVELDMDKIAKWIEV